MNQYSTQSFFFNPRLRLFLLTMLIPAYWEAGLSLALDSVLADLEALP